MKFDGTLLPGSAKSDKTALSSASFTDGVSSNFLLIALAMTPLMQDFDTFSFDGMSFAAIALE